MKILITGGCGFIGFNLAIHLIKANYDCHIIDNFYKQQSKINFNFLNKNFKNKFYFYNKNIESKFVNELIKKEKFDFIFHLAGQVSMLKSISDPYYDFKVNVIGTLNILEALRKYSNNTKLVYASSNKVYGNLDQYTYLELDTRYKCKQRPNGFFDNENLNFHSPYGCSKGAADQYVIDYSRIYNLQTVVFRHSTVYGTNQRHTFDQGWVGWFCSLMVEGKKINKKIINIHVNGNGKQVRDILFIDDLILLYDLVLKNFDNLNGKSYNVGGGIKNSVSIIELLNYLKKITDINFRIISNPPREGDQLLFISRNQKLTLDLKWTPKINYVDGVKRHVEWLGNKS